MAIQSINLAGINWDVIRDKIMIGFEWASGGIGWKQVVAKLGGGGGSLGGNGGVWFFFYYFFLF